MPTLLSAVLIVRDEAEVLAECLDALRDLVDEIVVHDTGSTDRSVEIARAAGARVVEGSWHDDFAAARNVAAEHATGEWLLVVDADELVRADARALRGHLHRYGGDAWSVVVRNRADHGLGEGYEHGAVRVVRRTAVRWAGRVHEQPVHRHGPRAGRPVPFRPLAPDVLALEHRGYADPETVRRKGERNAAIAEAELNVLAARGASRQEIAAVLVDLGRSLVTAGRRQHAVDTFETVREVVPGSPAWREATDFLARLLLGAGHDDVVVLLSDQLREAGADRRWCDWLRAQALAQLGRPEEALQLVRELDELVDTGGRRHDVGQVLEVRALLATLLGHRDEALDAIVRATAHHGRIRERGPMLLQLWAAARPGEAPEALAELVVAVDRAHLEALAAELNGCPAPGPRVAAALPVLQPA